MHGNVLRVGAWSRTASRLPVRAFSASAKPRKCKRSRPGREVTVSLETVADPHNRHSSSNNVALVRDFIHDSLYHRANGYFAKRDIIRSPSTEQALHIEGGNIGSSDGKQSPYPTPIDFSSIRGRLGYQKLLDRLYKDKSEAWLTPVEIFAPWYSYALARYLVEAHDRASQRRRGTPRPFRVVEIGGGSGANALHILNYLKANHSSLYEKSEYTVVEISPSLAKRQESILKPVHANHINIVNRDFVDWSLAATPIDQLRKAGREQEGCFILALEVFDNLPHDKVSLAATFTDDLAGQTLLESVVVASADESRYKENQRPLQDSLLKEAVELCQLKSLLTSDRHPSWFHWVRSKLGVTPLRSVFVPTGAVCLFKTLVKHYPNHKLLVADFDTLPTPDWPSMLAAHPDWSTAARTGPLAAYNAPIVASKEAGRTHDHSTYLVDKGSADIFFASDWPMLAQAYSKISGKSVEEIQIMKQSKFLEKFAQLEKTRTKTGYNPMLSDYTNTSMLLS